MHLFRRTTAAVVVGLALATLVTSPAHADETDTRTVTLPTPHTVNGLWPGCLTSLNLQGGPGISNTGVVHQSYTVTVRSAADSCGAVLWRTRATIVDESPGHPTRAVSGEGAPGNPSTATAQQSVQYGIGIREVGIITFQVEAWSAVGRVCFQERFVVDAAAWERRWLPYFVPC